MSLREQIEKKRVEIGPHSYIYDSLLLLADAIGKLTPKEEVWPKWYEWTGLGGPALTKWVYVLFEKGFTSYNQDGSLSYEDKDSKFCVTQQWKEIASKPLEITEYEERQKNKWRYYLDHKGYIIRRYNNEFAQFLRTDQVSVGWGVTPTSENYIYHKLITESEATKLISAAVQKMLDKIRESLK
jgi:hypothetical protein